MDDQSTGKQTACLRHIPPSLGWVCLREDLLGGLGGFSISFAPQILGVVHTFSEYPLIFDSKSQRKFCFKFVIPSILHALQHLLLSIPLLVEEVILHHKSFEDTHENP